MTPISKQFVAWVTGWRSSYAGLYRDNIFLRTALYVVALQVALVIVSVAAFSVALHYTNQQIINAVIAHAPSSFVGSQAQSLPDSINAIQQQTVRYVFAGVVTVAALFGALLAYVTLRPARTSLHYQKLFISNVAHELRTPLSTIKTSAEVGLLDTTLSPSARKALTDTVSELDRISEIINNLLSLNRLLRPERMEFQNVDLGPLIDRVVGRLSALANERGVEVIVRKNDYGTVWGNPGALEQVLTNILKNAVSYTPKDRGGLVTVSLAPNYRGAVVFSVADNGIGISQHDLFHIFEPFYRADLSRTRNIKKSGSGLGLAIVNEIVRVHRGKIHIQSAPSKGTTVSVILPTGTTPSGELEARGPKENLSEVSIDFSRGL
ncbi:MAG: HAMP domain-containing histidine kinase [Patescibacteria group bacterium]|nr:HAMP domain-containing histidine kinase [Patescibacteria group bacterium]